MISTVTLLALGPWEIAAIVVAVVVVVAVIVAVVAWLASSGEDEAPPGGSGAGGSGEDPLKDAGGDADKNFPDEPVDGATTSCEELKQLTITVAGLSFDTDHAMLTDHELDWAMAGTPFSAKDPFEWRPDHSFPITHTRNQKLTVTVEFKVTPADGTPAVGDAVGAGGVGEAFLKFRKNGVTFSPPMTTVTMTAEQPLPDEVTKLGTRWIDWTTGCSQGTRNAGTTGLHNIYVTYDTPAVEGKIEDGVTLKRMEKAIEWVSEAWQAGHKTPLAIVEFLFGKFPEYRLGFFMLDDDQKQHLKDHPDEWTALQGDGFADYMPNGPSKISPRKCDSGGAWLLAQNESYGGECQAIVRLIRGVIKQVGVPGKAETMYVNADASAPMTPVIRDYGSRPTGPDPKKSYALVDREVVVGNVYGQEDVGWNNYEAYLKFTDDTGQETWFGGGVGKLPPGYNQLKVFWGLAETESVFDAASSSWKRKVTKAWKY